VEWNHQHQRLAPPRLFASYSLIIKAALSSRGKSL